MVSLKVYAIQLHVGLFKNEKNKEMWILKIWKKLGKKFRKKISKKKIPPKKNFKKNRKKIPKKIRPNFCAFENSREFLPCPKITREFFTLPKISPEKISLRIFLHIFCYLGSVTLAKVFVFAQKTSLA